jgi:hypothetical protein
MYLFLSAFTSSPVYLLGATKDSAFLFIVCMYATYLALNARTLDAATCGPSDLRETVPLPRVQHAQNKDISNDM